MEPELFDLHAEVELDHWWFVARRRIMAAVLASVLPPSRDAVVVDVGCGTGANIAALAGAYTTVGIDTSPDAVRLAQTRFADVEFRCGVAPRDLDGRAAAPSAFLLMDVLEHVPDDRAVLEPLVEALLPWGYVLVTVPADMRLWSQHDVSFGHHRRYDLATLRAVWEGLAVREVMASYFNTRLYPLIRVVRAVSRWRGKSWGRAGSDLSVPPAPVNALLRRVFEGEAARLVELSAGRRRGYRRGVSLIALLERSGADDA